MTDAGARVLGVRRDAPCGALDAALGDGEALVACMGGDADGRWYYVAVRRDRAPGARAVADALAAALNKADPAGVGAEGG